MTARERFEQSATARSLNLDKGADGEYWITSTRMAWNAWQEAERQMIERCAEVCCKEAERCEQEAQRAIENSELEEVSAILSAAWKLSVAANRIRALGGEQ